ncbi:sugar O-acetyltransferase [Maritalea porphyrae]|uniref:sugar O-acetyltransferase n=1 Tax=Maritalea porphyrae TaxID=880732 RepID=UPI0022AF6EE9|nr:sugar O-acetyltransferase [Maritalea porphyrae]MCZ4273969.1 sugar O-acetyltransferase [Maritalea porphyrae]
MSKSAKELMLAGEPFLAGDPDLIAQAGRTRAIIHKFNTIEYDDPNRMDLLRSVLGKAPTEFWVESPFYVEYGEMTQIGERSFINRNCTIMDNHFVKIGCETLIAPNVQILTAGHPIRADERCVYPYPDAPDQMNFVNQAAPITIGDNCWIGAGVTILPGVTIGDRTTIGAGAVVTKDIPSDCVAVGSPARVVKKL